MPAQMDHRESKPVAASRLGLRRCRQLRSEFLFQSKSIRDNNDGAKNTDQEVGKAQVVSPVRSSKKGDC
ncbi:hypothetical protein Pla52o_11510 [Novipirellula galeiformis]|uniref:Uncharacterized protein n=1 Tax=Novipirellula galeiformis TaxID=2528004 RepID=A0A5C6CK80_9BACT|nr:hypothetical protein Pla52o_11510 [Novipirellula galeiformis]